MLKAGLKETYLIRRLVYCLHKILLLCPYNKDVILNPIIIIIIISVSSSTWPKPSTELIVYDIFVPHIFKQATIILFDQVL